VARRVHFRGELSPNDARHVKTKRSTLLLPTARGVRLVALEYLADAEKAADKLGLAHDHVALHDFRVAVRRLRSWVRAFEEHLAGAVARKDRHQLRDISDATNLHRDTEVQLDWLRHAAKGISRKRKVGAGWLRDYVRSRQRLAGVPLDNELIEQFRQAQSYLTDRLSRVDEPTKHAEKSTTSLAQAIAVRVMPHLDVVGSALKYVRSSVDEVPAHRARIAAKRLRYLIEPAAPHVKQGQEILERLKSLQDELGALHDAHVMAHQLHDALAASATTEVERLTTRAFGHSVWSADSGNGQATGKCATATAVTTLAPRRGMLALANRLRDDTERAFARIEKHWLGDHFDKFGRDVRAFAARLELLHAR